MRIEIDGHVPRAEALWSTASAFGHFTAMQVRRGRTRGLELHLRRLDTATQELFGSNLEGERIRALVRHALGDVADASVRVYVSESQDEPAVMVTVKEPAEIAAPGSAVGAQPLENGATRIRVVTDVYAALPWDPI